MVQNTSRRRFVKSSIGLATGIGAVASVGTAAAASGTVTVKSLDNKYDSYFEIVFDDNSGMSITTKSGSVEWHDWESQGDKIALVGTIAAEEEVTFEYSGTTAEEGDETEDDVHVVIN